MQKSTIIILEGSKTSMDTRKKYKPEFKKIVELVTETGKKPTQAAKNIGVHENG